MDINMKNLNLYIQEKLYHQEIDEKLIVNNTIQVYNYFPKTKDELIECIKEKIDKEGYGTKDMPLNLNDIDTSKITDMSNLFLSLDNGQQKELSRIGYFDIADWNVSNVKDMCSMFSFSGFNGDISSWNVSNVKDMNTMFYNSKFNGDISDWDVSSVESMNRMFFCSAFNGDISDWDVSNVKHMNRMFFGSKFNGDISDWDVSSIENMEMENMFKNCPLENNPPKWYKY